MRHPLPLSCLAVIAVAAFTACSPKPRIAAVAYPSGSYLLESVNGARVPCTVEHGGNRLAVKSGVFVLRGDGTCTSRIVFSPPSGGEVARDVKATWTRQGSTLTMVWEGAGTNTGTLEGNTFTMNNEGMIFTYRR